MVVPCAWDCPEWSICYYYYYYYYYYYFIIIIIIIIISMLLFSRSMDLWKKTGISSYVRVINCRFHLFRSSTSSSSSHYLILFLKSSRNCIVFCPTHFTSIICSSITPWRKQFLIRIRPTKLTFLRRILFRSVFFSPIH